VELNINIENIYNEFKENNIHLSVVDGRLKYEALSHNISENNINKLRQYKEDLICFILKSQKKVLCSFAQESIYFESKLFSTQNLYNNPFLVKIQGPLDIDLLTAGLSNIIKKHDVLRSYLIEEDGKIFQCYKDDINIQIKSIDCTDLVKDLINNVILDCLNQEIFIDQPSLLNAFLLKYDNTHFDFIVVFHHAISDGWSIELFFKDLINFYFGANETFYKGTATTYRDYSAIQRHYLELGKYKNSLAYWEKSLAKPPGRLKLPFGNYDNRNRSFHVGSLNIELGDELSRNFYEYSQQTRVSLCTSLVASLFILLHKLTHESDLSIGMPVLNRHNENDLNTLGYFSNVVTLRAPINDYFTFQETLLSINEIILNALENQEVPFEKVVSSINPLRNIAHNPLFQLLFALQMEQNKPEVAHDITFLTAPIAHTKSLLDISINLYKTDEGLAGFIQYNQEIFSESSINMFIQLYKHILHTVINNPLMKLKDIPLLSSYARNEILHISKGFQSTNGKVNNLFLAFKKAVELHGNKEAVSFYNQRLTYQELDFQSTLVAKNLIDSGVEPGSIIGLCINRSIEMVVMLLGILKAGSAYVPFDPSFPQSRLDYMLKDAQSKFLICDLQNESRFKDFEGQVLNSNKLLNAFQYDVQLPSINSNDLAYIIYTSGSTGLPKGVQINHANLYNLLIDMKSRVSICEFDKLLAVTTISFDISGLEIYLPLISGASVYLISEEDAVDGLKLKAHLENGDCTMMQATPTRWALLLESGWKRPESFTIMCGGEKLTRSLLDKLTITPEGSSVFNFYGPTETTIWSMAAELRYGDKVTLGRPILNTNVYIVDKDCELLPIGSTGEICISGAGVGDGYYNKPELTNQVFLNNPYSSAGHEMLYRTGDQGRYLDNGEIEFLGRSDNQIKLRGYRVEVGEIEECLMRHPSVKQAFVTSTGINENSTHLVAHMLPNTSINLNSIDFSLFFFSDLINQSSDDGGLYSLVLDSSKFADQHGLKAVWTPERHFHAVGGAYPNPAVLGAAIAMVTSNLEIRAGSVVLPLHDTLRVAEEWAVVDHLSGGRVGIAIAIGWNPKDFAFYPDRYLDRGKYTVENINVLKNLWQGGSLKRTDGHGKEQSLQSYPKPLQSDIPMWVTSSGGKGSFELAGATGSHVLTHLLNQDSEELSQQINFYKDTLEKHGYSAKERKVSLMLHTFVRETKEEALALCYQPFREYLRSFLSLESMALMVDINKEEVESRYEEILDMATERYIEEASLIGGIEECKARLDKFISLGVTEIACLVDFGVSKEEVKLGLPYINTLKEHSIKSNALDQSSIRDYLAKELPSYMVPTYYLQHESFPETLNGKVDSKALGAIPIMQTVKSMDNRMPETELEREIALIWEAVLNVKINSITDDFFTLGGHSILLIKLLATLNKKFGVALSAKTVFLNSTIFLLSKLVENERSKSIMHVQEKIRKINQDEMILATETQHIYWLIENANPNHVVNQKRYIWQINGQIDENLLDDTVNHIVNNNFLTMGFTENKDGIVINNASVSDIFNSFALSIETSEKIEDYLVKLDESNSKIKFQENRLFYFTLFKLNNGKQYLLFTHHRILLDALSVNIIIKEICNHYGQTSEKAIQGKDVNYKNYSLWQQEYRKSDEFIAKKLYWKNKNIESKLQYSWKNTISKVSLNPYEASSNIFVAQDDFIVKINKITKYLRISKFSLMLTSYILALKDKLKNSTITVGCPFTNRPMNIFDDVVGLFTNILPITYNFDNNNNELKILESIHADVLDAITNHEFSFDNILLNNANNYDDLIKNLFPCLFVYHVENQTKANNFFQLTEITPKSTNLFQDLVLSIVEDSSKITFEYIFKINIMETNAIEQIHRSMCKLIDKFYLLC